VSALFNARHGLEELTAEDYESAKIIDDDIEGTREERAFRFWINSLNIDDLYVTDLYEECKDGLLLLKVISKLAPDAVDWKVVEKTPNNKFKMSSNGGQVIKACQKLKLQLPGIGGSDIVDGNKKQVMAIVWQLVKLHYMQIIGSQTEEDLVKWANS